MRLTLIKPLETNKRYETCISCSLFESYKSVKFEFYFKSLRNDVYPSLNSKTFLRLHVDESVLIKPSFQRWIMDDKPNLEVYKYEDKRFLLEDGIHHDGTFGTMARFLPFFDKDLDVDYIWVSDVDMRPKDLTYDNINRMKKDNAKVSYISRCYTRDWIPEDIDYPMFAGTIIISKDVKISRYGYDKFLKDVYEDKYKDLKENIQGQKIAKTHEQNEVKFFIYGFDELYINTIAYKNFKKYTRLIEYDIQLFSLRWYHKDKELIDKLFYDSFLRGNNIKNFEKLYKMYDEISKDQKAIKNFKNTKCIKMFNEYKELARKDKNFTFYFLVKP
jgi:hypothetical protein